MGLVAMIPGAGFLVSIISIYSENLNIDVYPLLAILLYLAMVSIAIGFYFIFWGLFDMDVRRDKKKIYTWLHEQHISTNERWFSTIKIADGVNLLPERVREICHTHTEFEIKTKDTMKLNEIPDVEEWRIRSLYEFT